MEIPKLKRPIRYAMVGGGEGAFIGNLHRMIARLDGYWQLVAGAFSSTPEKSISFGQSLGLSESRCYGSWEALLKAETLLAQGDRAEVVIITTPNHTHGEIAEAALRAQFSVLSEKPATHTLEAVYALEKTFLDMVESDPRLVYGLTHNYVGYPIIVHARNLIAAGTLGEITSINGEYYQGWLVDPIEQGEAGNKQAKWRTNLALAGAGALGDIGSHLWNLSEFLVPTLSKDKVFADLVATVAGREADDYGNVLVEYKNGARANLRFSQIAVGHENDLWIEVCGRDGSIKWFQQEPNTLYVSLVDEPTQLIRAGAGMPTLSPTANALNRTPGGHPEGYLEGFGNLYRIFALQVGQGLDLVSTDTDLTELFALMPGIDAAVSEMEFIEQCQRSSRLKHWIG